MPFVVDSILQISMDFTNDFFTLDFRLLSEGLVIGSMGGGNQSYEVMSTIITYCMNFGTTTPP